MIRDISILIFFIFVRHYTLPGYGLLTLPKSTYEHSLVYAGGEVSLPTSVAPSRTDGEKLDTVTKAHLFFVIF